MSKVIENYLSQLRSDIPEFRLGDTVRVHAKVVEGSRTYPNLRRVSYRCHGAGISETFTQFVKFRTV